MLDCVRLNEVVGVMDSGSCAKVVNALRIDAECLRQNSHRIGVNYEIIFAFENGVGGPVFGFVLEPLSVKVLPESPANVFGFEVGLNRRVSSGIGIETMQSQKLLIVADPRLSVQAGDHC